MVYYRRSYKRRYNGKRKLTTSKILANKGARAQSYQIAKLNRRINYLTNQNRPEILTHWRVFDRTFTNSALASNYSVGWYVHPWGASSGKSYAESLNGDFCRAMGFNFKAIVEYSDNWSGNRSESENHQRSASYRIVILQHRNNELSLTDSNVFDRVFNVSSTTTSDDVNTTQPLKSGIKSVFKVLFSKTYTISNQHPSRQHNISIPAKKLLNFRREVNGSGGAQISDALPRGCVRVCLLTGGLHADSDFNSQVKVAATCKIAFTDN